jgi:hypothetical protein
MPLSQLDAALAANTPGSKTHPFVSIFDQLHYNSILFHKAETHAHNTARGLSNYMAILHPITANTLP